LPKENKKEAGTMLELLLTIVTLWLFFKALGLAFRLTWGAAKIISSLLFAVAIPLLGVILFFAGGLLVLIPLALMGAAFGILKSCV